MRFIVLQTNGGYVRMERIPGMSSKEPYAVSTPDFKDAHDFKSEAAARKWMRARRVTGKVLTLTDDGYFPCEE